MAAGPHPDSEEGLEFVSQSMKEQSGPFSGPIWGRYLEPTIIRVPEKLTSPLDNWDLPSSVPKKVLYTFFRRFASYDALVVHNLHPEISGGRYIIHSVGELAIDLMRWLGHSAPDTRLACTHLSPQVQRVDVDASIRLKQLAEQPGVVYLEGGHDYSKIFRAGLPVQNTTND